jgi:hypothetical protein
MDLTYRRTFSAGAAGIWMAGSLRGDDPRVRSSPRRPKGHPPGTGRPLGFAVLPQQSLDRGCDPRRFAGTHTPFLERLEPLRDPRSFVGAPCNALNLGVEFFLLFSHQIRALLSFLFLVSLLPPNFKLV